MRPSQPRAHRVAAVILCGGASSRMGTDKAVLDWNGAAAIDRLAALSERLGLRMVLTAGADHGLPAVFDARPGEGPCGGILAAAAWLSAAGYGRALILAVDAPTVTADDIRPLMDAGGPGAAYDGLPLPMVIELAAIPAEARANWALKRLVQAAGLSTLHCSDQARPRLRGANTPEERRHLLSELQAAAPSSSGTRSPSPRDGGLHEPRAGSIRPQHHG
ncbi:molybdenum cofactor guanylyltransferase [Phenylobacterium hankyongense]|uniref:Molybdenum cofactor guanylyltransferase n=1 Tax=Phenylobacterium hankyongense TaxID=1813876 RepID=A0A328B0X7_9CAUL|nr:molybdenum cofactor guanylyltransferase [Phenylobacterium hankyongense]